MPSLFDEISSRMGRDREQGRSRNSMAKFDMTLFLYNARDDLRELWRAADEAARETAAPEPLKRAVEKLRPLFGDKST